MLRHPVEQEGLAFKNLISGPATPGRILNYLRRCGEGRLRHQPGYRSTNLAGDVGCAWATEYILGLGLVREGADAGPQTCRLELTARGAEVYALLEGTHLAFNERNDSARTRREMARCAAGLEEAFCGAFCASWPFRILAEYLEEHGYDYPERARFLNDYFDEVKALYGDGSAYNRAARTTTGANRVPSLLQLCELFGMVRDSGAELYFDRASFSAVPARVGEAAERRQAEEETARVEPDVEELIRKYGVDGNELREVLLRNSAVQQQFKRELLAEQHGRCALCGLDVGELLVGSHIKPSARSTVVEKIDPNNGLLLCANHDKLFDRWLISFEDDGRLMVSESLDARQRLALGLRAASALGHELLTERRRAFLAEHRAELARREKERA